MLSNTRVCATFADARVAQSVVIAFAVVLGGCSADVTRFDYPFFGLTDKGSETGALPTPSESIARRNPSYDDGPNAAPRGAGLGDASRGYTPTPYAGTPAPYSGSTERLANAREEMAHVAEFDYVIINKDFQEAKRDLAAIFRATRLRTQNVLSGRGGNLPADLAHLFSGHHTSH